jgi:16S rRNA (cytosine1402-N4)-methyltransferase
MSEKNQRFALAEAQAAHIPVLLSEVVAALDPSRRGTFLDGTFGAGGYARAITSAGADHVIGLDRDPVAIRRAQKWLPLFEEKISLHQTTFADMETLVDAASLNGVVLDIGVSSMQIDEAERGFSFSKDGPLDMRMGDGAVRSASELVNEESEATLADIFFYFGEERAARRIARKIVNIREKRRIDTTLALADLIAQIAPRRKADRSHPAARAFQALRIAVNSEFNQLAHGLAAAERVLAPHGVLAIVTFHSLEDRIVKRFFAQRVTRSGGGGSRYAPRVNDVTQLTDAKGNFKGLEASFTAKSLKPIKPGEPELESNPRSRSAKLRFAVRTNAPATPLDVARLGAPQWLDEKRRTNR